MINLWVEGKKFPIYKKIAKTFINSFDDESVHDRRAFWENVSFYNFIQAMILEGPRTDPLPEMWEKSKLPFLEVINDLSPQLIIVLGRKLNDNLPTIPDGIVVCPLIHPSSGGYSYSENRPLVLNAIEAVKSKPT